MDDKIIDNLQTFKQQFKEAILALSVYPVVPSSPVNIGGGFVCVIGSAGRVNEWRLLPAGG